MFVRWFEFVTAVSCCLGVIGCAPRLSAGDRALRAGAIDEAVHAYEKDLDQKPENVGFRRGLALAYLKQGRTDDAIRELSAILALDPGDGEAVLYLGMAEELRGEVDQAVERYRDYLATGAPRYREDVRDRLAALLRQRTARWARDRVAFEDSLAGGAPSSRTIAVLALGVGDESGRLDGLGDALAGQFMTDLGRVRALTLVERLRMDAILRELDLARAGAVEPGSAPRMGRLMGAGRLVTGDVTALEENRIRVDVGIVDAQSGEVLPVADEGSLDDFFRLEAALVFRMLDAMGIVPTPLEREEIERVPTRSLAAFLAYGRGLALERGGHYEAARAAFDEALALDPGFADAAEARESVPAGSPPPIRELVMAVEPPGGGGAGETSALARDQLTRLLDRTGDGVFEARPEDLRVPPTVPVAPIPDPPTPPGGSGR